MFRGKLRMQTSLQILQSKHPEVPGHECTHVIHNNLYKQRKFFLDDELSGALCEAYAKDASTALQRQEPMYMNENLGPQFSFFFLLKCHHRGDMEACAKEVFGVLAGAVRDCCEDIPPDAVYCVVLFNRNFLRFQFPRVVVNTEVALHIHRYALVLLSERLLPSTQKNPFGSAASFYWAPWWLQRSPHDVYVSGLTPIPMLMSTHAVKCTAMGRSTNHRTRSVSGHRPRARRRPVPAAGLLPGRREPAPTWRGSGACKTAWRMR